MSTVSSSSRVHPHWSEFVTSGQLPLSAWIYNVAAVYVTALSILGCLSNAVLFTVFTSRKRLRTPSNLLVANLAVSDFALSVMTFPLMSVSAFARNWVFGETGCPYFAFTSGLFAFVNIFTMAAIALDRCFSITKCKFWNLTFAKTSVLIFTIWLFASALVIPPLCGWTKYILESMQISCTFDFLTHSAANTAYMLYIFLIGFIFPLSVIMTSYALIIVHFIRHHNFMKNSKVMTPKGSNKSGTSSSSGTIKNPIHELTFATHYGNISVFEGSERKVAYNYRATLTSVIIVACYVFAWTPYAVVALIGVFGNQETLTPLMTTIPNFICKLTAVSNPVVYAFQNKEFRKMNHRKAGKQPLARLPLAQEALVQRAPEFRNAKKCSLPTAVLISPNEEDLREYVPMTTWIKNFETAAG